MRLLLDESIDELFVHDLKPYDAEAVDSLGWKSLKNGDLLDAAQDRLAVLLTGDKTMPFQTNVSKRQIAVVDFELPSLLIDQLRQCVPSLMVLLPTVERGNVSWLSPQPTSDLADEPQ